MKGLVLHTIYHRISIETVIKQVNSIIKALKKTYKSSYNVYKNVSYRFICHNIIIISVNFYT